MNKPSIHIVLLCTILGLTESRVQAEEDFSITLVQPGAGFLVAGEENKVPLELILRSSEGKKKLKRATVNASMGKARKTRIVANNRVLFMYTPPRSPNEIEEVLDVDLQFSDGSKVTQGLGFQLPKPQAPRLDFTVSDLSIDANKPKRINLSTSAISDGIQGLKIYASHGELSYPGAVAGSPNELFAGATLTPPLNMPAVEPSHFMLLSVAASKRGFAAQVSGVSTYARVRLRAELPKGSKFVLTGTRDNPPPVTAPADGFTTSYGIIEYGQPVRAYRVRGRRKKEIPITIPTGLVPDGMAVAIPGQDVADGGTGPTILVAIPPSPFGDEPYWPEIEVEGAKKIKVLEVSSRIRALSFTRPKKPQTFTVLADRAPIGTIEFKSSHAAILKLEKSFVEKSERGAVIANVFDPMGGPSDHPAPLARIEDGPDLPIQRIEPGKFRISIPSNVPGETGEEISIVAELPALNVVHGDPPELVQRTTQIELEGPPPAIRAGDEPSKVTSAQPTDSGPIEPIGLNVYSSFSSGFLLDPRVNFGADFKLEFRLPPMDYRFSIMSGVEYATSENEGIISFGDDETLLVSNQNSNVSIPVIVGFQLWKTKISELSLRAGVELRLDSSVLDQEGVRIAGSKTSQIAGRAGMAYTYSFNDIIGAAISAGLRGLGASSEDGTAGSYEFTGTLMQAYLNLGLRISL